MTSQAQMAADELGVALSAIDMVMGDTDRCPWDMGTFGSLTTRMFGPALRAAAAEARSVLLGLAAKQLGVARAELTVENGIVTVAADPSRRVTYGELAKGRHIARLVGDKAVLRKVKEFQVMGRSPERLDARAKVTGAAEYAGDIRRPACCYACILRPPGARRKRKQPRHPGGGDLPGVVVVRRRRSRRRAPRRARRRPPPRSRRCAPSGSCRRRGPIRSRSSTTSSRRRRAEEIDRRGDLETARARAVSADRQHLPQGLRRARADRAPRRASPSSWTAR